MYPLFKFLLVGRSVLNVFALAPTKIIPMDEAVPYIGINPTVTRHKATPIVETIDAAPAAAATGSFSIGDVSLFSRCIWSEMVKGELVDKAITFCEKNLGFNPLPYGKNSGINPTFNCVKGGN